MTPAEEDRCPLQQLKSFAELPDLLVVSTAKSVLTADLQGKESAGSYHKEVDRNKVSGSLGLQIRLI
jgi:hypothetical protein